MDRELLLARLFVREYIYYLYKKIMNGFRPESKDLAPVVSDSTTTPHALSFLKAASEA